MRTCPTCGESCAQAWCGFCERMLPLESGCAFGQCTDPDCVFCTTRERWRVVPCSGEAEGLPCRLVKGHHGWCQPVTKRKAKGMAADKGVSGEG